MVNRKMIKKAQQIIKKTRNFITIIKYYIINRKNINRIDAYSSEKKSKKSIRPLS